MTLTTTTSVIENQAEEIVGLKRMVAQLHQQLEEARVAAIGNLSGALRLRETVLLYVGADSPDVLQQQFTEAFGVDVARQTMCHLFCLDNAPVPAAIREQMRLAFNHGMTRW